MHEIIYYVGLVLLILGAIGIGFSIYKLNKDKVLYLEKEKNTLDLQTFFRKNRVYSVVSITVFLLGFIFLNYAFFIDEATQNNIDANNLVLDAGHLFLAFGCGIIFILSVVFFVYTFFIYYYLDKKQLSDKVNKINKILFYVSIPLMIVFFILYSEGLAPYLVYPLANAIHFGADGIYLRNTYTGGNVEGFDIALYAVCILSGAVIVLFVCDHLTYKEYGEHGLLYTCFLFAFPMGIVGARAWYVVLDISDNGANSQYITNPASIFNLRQGGLGIMGGAILGIIVGVSVMLVYKYGIKKEIYKKINYLHLADIIVPTILVAQAIGRWGNFFNNEVNGYPIDVSYFSFLPTFVKNNMIYADHGSSVGINPGEIYLPLFFVEFCTNMIGYFFIHFLFTKGYLYRLTVIIIKKIKGENYKDYDFSNLKNYVPFGSATGMYLVWYGATRAVLEPLRTGSDFYQASVYSSYALIGIGLVIVTLAILFKIFVTDKKIPNIILKTVYGEETPAIETEVVVSENTNSENTENVDVIEEKPVEEKEETKENKND